MDNLYLSAVVEEIAPEVENRSVARVSLASSRFLLDLRLGSGRQLVISMDRSNPALYLTSLPTVKADNDKQMAGAFISLLRKHIFDARLTAISKAPLDRIVQLDFERLLASDDRITITFLLVLTGSSANAHLIDSQGNPIASLFAHPRLESNLPRDLLAETNEPASPVSMIGDLDDSTTQDHILARFWGADSIFGPQLRTEFVARCADNHPLAALKSLVNDLFTSKPVPLLYSRIPLDQIGQQLMNPKDDLMLSHIELVRARGMLRYEFGSLSEAADQYYSARARAAILRADYSSLRQLLAREISRQETTLKAIASDRLRFKDPDKLKRCGDLILANLANAKVTGSRVSVVDYYDPAHSEIEIEIPEGARLQDAAADYFARYQKARRAQAAISSRALDLGRKLDPLKRLLSQLESARTAAGVQDVRIATDEILGRSSAARPAGRARGQQATGFGRRFRSSDGYEIVVGRNDRENDALTFRVARPSDTWLHAADYPGSHVIIRNPSRQPLPHRTIIEAAELAAFYSQAKREGKAAVHYTQKKLVSKPPRAKPGLVRLSSFKTAMVEPRCAIERVE